MLMDKYNKKDKKIKHILAIRHSTSCPSNLPKRNVNVFNTNSCMQMFIAPTHNSRNLKQSHVHRLMNGENNSDVSTQWHIVKY